MAKQKEKEISSQEKGKEKEELRQAIEEIKQRFGEGAIMRLKDIRPVDVDCVSTGSISLDMALGVGGIPRGRIIEIFGAESSGKTTLALHVIAESQKKGGTCAFVDAEHALDSDYARKIGVKIEDLLISQPSSGEEGLQVVERLVRSGMIDVIAIDSVAALTPQTEIDGEVGQFQIGLQARLMSQALRKLAGVISKTKTIVIFLNQTRMKIGGYGNPETTPGGLALKFYSSVRINLGRRAQIKSGEAIIGNRVSAKIVKNKVAAPFKSTEFDIYYNEGISKMADLIRTGLEYKVLKQSGAWYQLGEEKLGQGMEKAKEFLRGNPKMAEQIKKEIMARAKEEKKEENNL